MGFIKKVLRCGCKLPNPVYYDIGTVWECDKCHRRYEIQSNPQDAALRVWYTCEDLDIDGLV